MARITGQKGHCFRKSGATGGSGEQTFADRVVDLAAGKLRDLGHDVAVVLADQDVPDNRDVFFAVHTDGSSNAAVHGASVGYPADSDGRLAQAWKRAWQRAGYAWGFHRDNYTVALRRYYGFGRAVGYRHEFLAEFGMHSNPEEYVWLHAHYEEAAASLVAAIGEIVGHPRIKEMTAVSTNVKNVVRRVRFPDGRRWYFASDGGVFNFDGSGFFGSMGGKRLNAPIVDALVTSDGGGYILVGEDGGLFHFGNAPRIQAYGPLQREWAAGDRKVVSAEWTGVTSLALTANILGNDYDLAL